MQQGENRSVSSGERHTLYHQFIPHIKCTSTSILGRDMDNRTDTTLYRKSFTMNKLLTCRYNMDTDRVEARFEDAPLLPSTASPWKTNTATPRHSGQNWTGCCTISPWSMHRWCWVGRSNVSCHSAVTTADWKINDITNTAPPWRRRSQSGAVFVMQEK